MAASAGYLAAVSVSTNDSSYSTVGKLDSMNFDLGVEELDTGAFNEAGGSAIAGRKVFTGTASGTYDPADSGQAAVITAAIGTGQLYVKVLTDGTNGYKCACFIPPVKINAGVGEAGKFEFSWRQVAAPTAVP